MKLFVFVMVLYGYHAKILISNHTTHENLLGFYINIKNPFDKGTIWRNIYSRIFRIVKYKSQLGAFGNKFYKNKVVSLDKD